MKMFLMFLLGAATGFGAVYMFVEHDEWIERKAGLRLQFTERFLDSIQAGDRVALTEAKFGYAVNVLDADELKRMAEPPVSNESTGGATETEPEKDDAAVRVLEDVVGALVKDLLPPQTQLFEVTDVRRDHIVLRNTSGETIVPVSQIARISRPSNRPVPLQ